MMTDLVQVVNKPDQVFTSEARDTSRVLLPIEHDAEFAVRVG